MILTCIIENEKTFRKLKELHVEMSCRLNGGQMVGASFYQDIKEADVTLMISGAYTHQPREFVTCFMLFGRYHFCYYHAVGKLKFEEQCDEAVFVWRW